MRVVLVQPPLSLKERYGTLGRLGYIEPPVGLCYLAAVARQRGFEVEIIDAQALALDFTKTKEAILSSNPRVVGITAVSQLIVGAGRLAKEIKNTNKEIITVLGGCHLTSLPRETMLDFPDFDIGVLGEGEDAFSEILESLELGRDTHSIKGTITRKNGDLIQAETRGKIKDLDKFPFPALDLLPKLDRHYRVCVQSCDEGSTISLNTSRGCASQCTFCDSSIHGRQLRYHSADYVFKMLKDCVRRYNTTSFFFNDSNFFLPFERFKKLSDLIERNKLRIKWSCMSRIDIVNEEILNLAKKTGCRQVLYGIESGSQEIIDFYKKGTSLEKIRKNLFLTKKAGISAKGFFIFGSPGETEKTMRISIDFMRHIDLDDVGISLFVPFPGTVHYGNVHHYGTMTQCWEKMSTYAPVFIPRGLSEEKLLKYMKAAYRKFYFRPRIIISYIKRCRSFSQIKNFILAGLILLYYTLFEADKQRRGSFNAV